MSVSPALGWPAWGAASWDWPGSPRHVEDRDHQGELAQRGLLHLLCSSPPTVHSVPY